MALPEHLSKFISSRIEEYLRGPADPMREYARTNGALPVYADVDGSLFLTPEGEVLVKGGGEANSVLGAQASAHWCLVAKLAAAERFPELSELIPARPHSASDCTDCEGRGKVLNDMIRCGVCYGLGWIEPATNASPDRPREG